MSGCVQPGGAREAARRRALVCLIRAGQTLPIVDAMTGAISDAQLFIAVMGQPHAR